MNSEAASPGSNVRPARLEIVSDLLRKCQEKGRRGRSRRVMGYLLVCDSVCANGNSILTSVSLLILSGGEIGKDNECRKESNIIHS